MGYLESRFHCKSLFPIACNFVKQTTWQQFSCQIPALGYFFKTFSKYGQLFLRMHWGKICFVHVKKFLKDFVGCLLVVGLWVWEGYSSFTSLWRSSSVWRNLIHCKIVCIFHLPASSKVLSAVDVFFPGAYRSEQDLLSDFSFQLPVVLNTKRIKVYIRCSQPSSCKSLDVE